MNEETEKGVKIENMKSKVKIGVFYKFIFFIGYIMELLNRAIKIVWIKKLSIHTNLPTSRS